MIVTVIHRKLTYERSTAPFIKRLTMLTQRWYTAKRMNMDYGILYQLELLLQGVEYEKMRRMQPPLDNNPVVIDTDAEPKDK